MDPDLIYTYETQKNIISLDMNRFNSPLLTDALIAVWSLLMNLGTQRAVSLCQPHISFFFFFFFIKLYILKCPMSLLSRPPESKSQYFTIYEIPQFIAHFLNVGK